MKRLAVDLVILNERASSYIQDLQIALETLVRTSRSAVQPGAAPARGAVFVLRADLIPQGTRALLLSVARAVLVGRNGTLSEQLDRPPAAAAPRARAPLPARVPATEAAPLPPGVELEFFNGLGGFADGGREYVTVLDPGRATPAPWINVVANPRFGFQVSAEGASTRGRSTAARTRSRRGRTIRSAIRSGEVLYVRDEDSGLLWTPTAHPIRDASARYVARHGQGYSRFEHSAHGIALDLLQFVPLDDPIKISRLTLRNLSSRTRRLSVTAYVEWVLGPARAAAAFSLVTEMDGETGAHVRPQSVELGLLRTHRVRRPARQADGVDRRPPRVHRPQRHARRPGRAGRRPRAVAARGRRPRSVRRAADGRGADGWGPRSNSSSCSARQGARTRRATW